MKLMKLEEEVSHNSVAEEGVAEHKHVSTEADIAAVQQNLERFRAACNEHAATKIQATFRRIRLRRQCLQGEREAR